jgi:hypothetical protein
MPEPLEEKYGFVPDRDALRERLEQEIGFADYGKYARLRKIRRQQFLEGLRLIVPQDDMTVLSPVPGGAAC